MQHDTTPTTVFVYGSLMRGLPLHGALADGKYLGRAELHGFCLYDLGPYPGIRRRPGEGVVLGELYEVTAETLSRLDSIEGEGYLYRRTRVDTLDACGQLRDADTYVYLGSDGSPLPSGTRWGS
jgi:gamma-glutamylcyclotransferase (GGCT)/AIG2-like uncharacterized protein YtfP